jgi:hypothetical protein
MKLSRQQLDAFDEQGFLLIRGALDPGEDLAPCKQELSDVFDSYAHILMNKWAPDLAEGFASLRFVERFAILLGLTEGDLFVHLEPQVHLGPENVCKLSYLPAVFLPELFLLSHNPKLLDILESFFGPEIVASSNTHINLKLAPQFLQLGHEVSRKYRTGKFSNHYSRLNFQQTRWHTDSKTRNADSRAHRMIVAWTPLTDVSKENSCLLVAPGSYKEENRTFEDEYRNALPIECSLGDLVVFDANLIHASTPNTTESDHRLTVSFRYVKKGTMTGHYGTPDYVVRSESAPEQALNDPRLYYQYVNAAVDFFHLHPTTQIRSGRLEKARKISKAWQKRIRRYDDWLDLRPDQRSVFKKIRQKARSILG